MIGRLALLLSGVLVLKAIEVGLHRLIGLSGIVFPASVTGMLLVFGLLLAMRPSVSTRAAGLFEPAVRFTSRWMALFFVPALVALLEIPPPPFGILARIAVLLVLGFLFTLIITAWLAHRLAGREAVSIPPAIVRQSSGRPQLVWTGISVAAAIAAAAGVPIAPDLAMLAITILGFLAGGRVQEWVGGSSVAWRLVAGAGHPVITSTAAAILALQLGMQPVSEYLRGSFGAGRALMALLGPAVIALGFVLYERRHLLQRHLRPLGLSLLLSAPVTMFVTALGSGLLHLPEPFGSATLPRSITTPIAMPVAVMLGADPALTAAYVVLTGVIGAVWGPGLLRTLRLGDAVTEGIAIGASAHGIGTAALLREDPGAAAVAGVSFAIMGALTTLYAAIPAVRQALMSLL